MPTDHHRRPRGHPRRRGQPRAPIQSQMQPRLRLGELPRVHLRSGRQKDQEVDQLTVGVGDLRPTNQTTVLILQPHIVMAQDHHVLHTLVIDQRLQPSQPEQRIEHRLRQPRLLERSNAPRPADADSLASSSSSSAMIRRPNACCSSRSICGFISIARINRSDANVRNDATNPQSTPPDATDPRSATAHVAATTRPGSSTSPFSATAAGSSVNADRTRPGDRPPSRREVTGNGCRPREDRQLRRVRNDRHSRGMLGHESAPCRETGRLDQRATDQG